MSNIETIINHGVLVHAVGRQMFCPECKTCLDVDNAVLLTNDVTSQAAIACGECFDLLTKDNPAPANVEVIDGRAL